MRWQPVWMALFIAINVVHGQPLAVSAGGITEFESDVSADLKRRYGKQRRSAVESIHGLVAVPAAFDPARAWPVLVVSATSDPGYNSSRALARRYIPDALAAGWVVVAADPAPAVVPETNEVRYVVVQAALHRLASAWPGAESWPVAFGGFSGGAKYSGFLAAMSGRDGRMPAGIFLGGCNAATPASGLIAYKPPRKQFREVPIFLSSGDQDPIATPADHESVRRELANSGFRRVRLATYQGRHVIHPAHMRDALMWFDSVRSGRVESTGTAGSGKH